MKSFYADATKLSPPINVDGVLYSLAIQFKDQTQNPSISRSIVSGTVFSASDLGGGQVEIVCLRSPQSSASTVVQGVGQSYEREWISSMGGNVAYTDERQRLYSFVSESNERGNRVADRAVPGDVLEINGVKGIILEAEAFGSQPSSVDYSGDDPPVQSIRTVNASVPIVIDLGDSEEAVFEGDDFDWNDDTFVFFVDQQVGGDTGFSTRKIFVNSGQPDPDFYPYNGQFSSIASEYWRDPVLPYQHYLSFSTELLHTPDLVQVVYYRKNVPVLEGLQTYNHVVVTASPAVYAGASGDEVGGACHVTAGDFSIEIEIGGGDGAIEWRTSANDFSAVHAISFVSSGGNITFTETHERNQDSATIINTPISVVSTGATVRLRAVKVTDLVTFQYWDGVTWLAINSLTMVGVEEDQGGLLSIVAGGTQEWVKIINPTIDFSQIDLLGFPLLYMRDEVTTSVEFTWSVEIPVGESLVSVFNVTVGDFMVERVPPEYSRRVYEETATHINFFSECAGDEILIIFTNSTVSAPPGEAPRVTSDQANFADASTNTATNRANWRDRLVVFFEGDVQVSPDDNFSITRDPVFSPVDPPDLFFDGRETSSPVTDWALIAPSNYLARWVEGWVLFRQDYVNTLPPDRLWCFKAEGDSFHGTSQFSEALATQIKQCIEVLDQAWTQASGSGSESRGLSGDVTSAGEPGLGATGWACEDIGGGNGRWDLLGLAIGRRNSRTGALWTDLNSHGPVPSFPFRYNQNWVFDTRFGAPVDPASWPDLSCSPESNISEQTLCDPGEGYTVTYDASEVPPVSNNFGGSISTDLGGSSLVFDPFPRIGASFNFRAIGLALPPLLGRMPEGAEIVEAKMEVKFDNLSVATTALHLVYKARNLLLSSPEYPEYLIEWTENGVLTKSRDQDGIIINIAPPPDANAGNVSMAILGERKDTRQVFDHFLQRYDDVNGNQFTSYGSISGGGGSVTSGLWSLLDVTSMMNAFLDGAVSSEEVNFYAVPTQASGLLSSGGAALGHYALSLMPEATVVLEGLPDENGKKTHRVTYDASAQVFYFDDMEVGSIFIRYRLGGVVSSFTMPVALPPMVANPSG